MIALDPKQTFDVKPSGDGGLVFRCRFPTARQWLEIERHLRIARDGPDGGRAAVNGEPPEIDIHAAVAELVAAVGTVLVEVGFPGEPTPWRPKSPDLDVAAFLTCTELWSLVYLILSESRMQEADRRKSASPSRSPAAPPASTAAPDGAATASQPRLTPSS